MYNQVWFDQVTGPVKLNGPQFKVDMKPKYFPRNRKPQKEEIIPFSIKKPIELKSAITGVGGRDHGQACLYELSLVLACFKQTSYSQIACANEISNFQKCFSRANKEIQDGNKDNKNEMREKPSVKNEINKLLKTYSTK